MEFITQLSHHKFQGIPRLGVNLKISASEHVLAVFILQAHGCYAHKS